MNTLRSIAIHQDLTCSLHSKNDLYQSILYNLQIRSEVERLVRSWLGEWGEVLLRIGMSNRSQFSSEEIEALFMATGMNRDDINRALGQGWMFARQDRSLRPRYVIPMEIHEAIQASLFRDFTSKVVNRETEPLIQRDEVHALVNDLHTLIDYVLNHEVQLTTDGAMYKRHTQQLMELFEVPEDLKVSEWRFGYGRRTHDYPDRLALLYDFAYQHGILVESTNLTLQVSEAGMTWREKSRPGQLQRMVHFYLSLYRRPIPRLRDIVEVIRRVADRWVSSSSVLAACDLMVNSFYYDTQEDVWNTRIVKMLTHLGVLRTGFDQESDDLWFQMTNLGQELLTQDEMDLVDKTTSQASLIVQPNFEVMVTVHDGKTEAVLSQFADLKSAGAIRIYRILERTVERGFQAGYDFTAWRDMLTKCSLGPIPGNVERTLIEWQAAHQSSSRPLSS
ncbi:helicase-associated domain-containing protein [Alicyclobacillus dauci]|uniref:Helicase-associated domain-containing protein n=1 Tax=Alicyclobacillus dauci TaxID=1475485 RepID=A0ABY6YX91_9BACL|nr:helicase-associated domain-containing protein [Alicyclobacillus dauci]WAH35132.1 helicase-associated domain-containing protein [Alicyclobacillus dauci]